ALAATDVSISYATVRRIRTSMSPGRSRLLYALFLCQDARLMLGNDDDQLVALIVVNCAHLDEAIEAVGSIPAAGLSTVEIRPIWRSANGSTKASHRRPSRPHTSACCVVVHQTDSAVSDRRQA